MKEEESKQGNRQPSQEARVSLRSGEGEETNQIVSNEEGQLVKQQQEQQQERPQQVQQQHTTGGEVVLVAEAASNSSHSSSSMRRSILPATLSSSEGNTPSRSDRPVGHDMMGGDGRHERVTMHPLASPSNGFEPVASDVDGDSTEPVGNEHAGGPETTVMKESTSPNQFQSIPSSPLSPKATLSQQGAAV